MEFVDAMGLALVEKGSLGTFVSADPMMSAGTLWGER